MSLFCDSAVAHALWVRVRRSTRLLWRIVVNPDVFSSCEGLSPLSPVSGGVIVIFLECCDAIVSNISLKYVSSAVSLCCGAVAAPTGARRSLEALALADLLVSDFVPGCFDWEP